MKLSSKLSPRTKRAVLAHGQGDVVSGLIHVSPMADRDTFAHQLENAGATVRAWMGEAGVVSFEIPADRLEGLAGLRDVVYVEAGEPYTPAGESPVQTSDVAASASTRP